MLPRQILTAENASNATYDHYPSKGFLDIYQGKAHGDLEIHAAPLDRDSNNITPPKGMDDLLIRPMEELQQMAIAATMRKYNGNVTQASRVLKISPSSIYRKKARQISTQ